MLSSLSAGLVLSALVAAAPQPRASVSISINGGTFVGEEALGIQRFLGIPFAHPPVGDLRFRRPVSIASYNGTYDATNYGASCPAQGGSTPDAEGLDPKVKDWIASSIFGEAAVDPEAEEDCLTLNVVKPASATPSSKLPVLVWIYGGGFTSGNTKLYDGRLIVKRSQDQGQPVVFVSMNYRATAFGFLASKEVRQAGVGNLGLHDQREALRWVQKYITQFGGDPTKVTIWGESAGAISAALHMIANNGNNEGLFRGAFMQSGAPIPVGSIDNGQVYYDEIVRLTGCSGSSDTLQCLRRLPYNTLKAAIDQSPSTSSYQALRLAWLPRVDGVLITDEPFKLVQQGKVANIPYVSGNCDDEGTLFSLSTLNITTTAQFKNWIKNTFLLGASDEQVTRIAELYPSDITKGSPFGTSILNAITLQFKRIAAFQGDGVFQAPRRWFLRHTSHKQNTWAYLSKRFKVLPVLGAAHATDLVNSFFIGREMNEHVIRFTYNLDPNGGKLENWPKYNTETKKILVYRDNIFDPITVQEDTYREEAMEYLISIVLDNPV